MIIIDEAHNLRGNLAEKEDISTQVTVDEEDIQKLIDLPKTEKIMYFKYRDIFDRQVTTCVCFDIEIISNASESWPSFHIESWTPIIPV